MKNSRMALPVLLLLVSCMKGQVTFVTKKHQIDVFLGGDFVTAYRFDPAYTKPVLFPLKTPSGLILTRGFPFEELEGESRDHPHHAGLFFTYDRVNNEGFWNNTDIPPQISHEEMLSTGAGTLKTSAHWKGKNGNAILREERTVTFRRDRDAFILDFNIRLVALERTVFADTKEGMFAIRVAPWLREDRNTGFYLSSAGDSSAQSIWGTRASWVKLEGESGNGRGGIVIFNHPESVNYPTYWHARAYGLFSANPLGQFVFEKTRGNPSKKGPVPFNLTLENGEEAIFKFRVLLYDGSRNTEEIISIFEAYTAVNR